MTNNDYIDLELRRKFRTNLKDLLYLYEKNYIKIKALFSEIHKTNKSTFLLPEGVNHSRVNFKIFRESKYTSLLVINQSSLSNPNLISTKIEIAIYHDVKMAEVRSFNGKRQFWVRNKYPNKNMFQKDEKFQWNKFLFEWLEFSKKEGLAEVLLKLTN